MAQTTPATETPPPSQPQKHRSTRTRYKRAARATILGLSMALGGCATMKKGVNWMTEEEEVFHIQKEEATQPDNQTVIDDFIEQNAQRHHYRPTRATVNTLRENNKAVDYHYRSIEDVADRYYALPEQDQIMWMLQDLDTYINHREWTCDGIFDEEYQKIARYDSLAQVHEALQARLQRAENKYEQKTQRLEQQLLIARAENRGLLSAPKDTVELNIESSTLQIMNDEYVRDGEVMIKLGDTYFVMPDATHICSEPAQTCLRVQDVIKKGYELQPDTTQQRQPL